LGVIAYEVVTGRKPFNPETGYELLEMQRAGVRVKPKDLRPSLSDEASDLILRTLSFDAQQRFGSARDFGDALGRALAEHSSQVPAASPSFIPATQLATDANVPGRQTAGLSPQTIAGRYEPARVDTLHPPSYVPAVKDEAPSRGWGKVATALVVLVVLGAAAGVLIWKRDALFGGAQRSFTYSLTVQKMRDGKSYQGEFESSGQEIFENGWKFRLNLSSPQDGYLYLLNEGPDSANTSTYHVLFPESKTNGGSPQVTANQVMQTDWMRFDDNQGTEKFWLVWSTSPVKELEAVKDFVNENDLGEVKDATKARGVRDFLTRQSQTKPDVTKDSVKKQTVVKGRGDTLVNFIELEHR
jgi:hypothetical protein